MAALDDGRVQTIRELAVEMRAQGHRDVSALLETALTPTDELHPTAQRKRWKAEGIGNPAERPTLDILRAWAKWREDGKVTPPRALREWSDRSVFAAIAFEALKGNRSRRLPPEWMSHWPRWCELAMMTTMVDIGFEDPVEAATQRLGKPRLDWSKERWPDLADGAAGPFQRETLNRLLERSKPPSELEVDHAVKQATTRPRPERRQLLGRCLQRFEQDLRGPTPRNATPWCRTAVLLTRTIPGLHALHHHLETMDLQLSALCGDPGARAFACEMLWLDPARTEPERVHLARELTALLEMNLLDGGPPLDVLPKVVREAIAVRLADEQTLEARAKTVGRLAEHFTASTLTLALPRDLSPAHRKALLARHAVRKEDPRRALPLIRECVLSGDAEVVTRAATEWELLLEEIDADESGRRMRALLESVLEAVAGLETADARLALDFLGALYECEGIPLSMARAAEILRPALERGVPPAESMVPADLAQRCVVAAHLGWDEQADRAVRGLGRVFRSPTPAMERLALETLGRLEALNMRAKEEPIRWSEALGRFLLRDGSGPLRDRLEKIRDLPRWCAGAASCWLEDCGDCSVDWDAALGLDTCVNGSPSVESMREAFEQLLEEFQLGR